MIQIFQVDDNYPDIDFFVDGDKLMKDFERTLVKSFNESFTESNTPALGTGSSSQGLRLSSSMYVDCLNPDLYLGIECKSISVEKGASALYFKQHFTTDKKGIQQIERISEFLRQTGRRGFLTVELRMGAGHSKEAYLIPWGVVEKQYREKVVQDIHRANKSAQ